MAARVLPELVLADDPEVDGAEVDVGGDVGGPDEHHPHAVLVEQQPPPELAAVDLGDPGFGKQLEAAFQEHPRANGDGDGHRLAS